MQSRREREVDHLFRRAGFGASEEEVAQYARLGFSSFPAAVARLINYSEIPDDVDSHIQTVGYVGVTARADGGRFSPATNILDARQRWLFRMVHSQRPLQEKMALFWHNHFATAYAKVQNDIGDTAFATRMFSAKPGEDGSGMRGQVELFREYALGNFRDLVIEVAKDPAMLVWLDGRTNFRNRPQENFARELMELFTMGVGRFEETDVYAGARVFTGWNLNFVGRGTPQARYEFFYNPAQHDTTAKDFTFAIYPDGARVIPARSAGEGMQDGIDLINAVVRHPATGPRLARKLYGFFINEVDPPDQGLLDVLSRTYYSRNFAIEPMVQLLLLSPQFREASNYYKRYSWPVEFVVRSLKEVGFLGFSLNSALNPLVSMGQQLFEPPDVNGWELGPGWFSSGGMLARMNFAATLATNQRNNLRDQSTGKVDSPESLLSFMLDRLTPPEYASSAYTALLDYTRAGGAWTGSPTQLATKAAGLAHLIAGSGDYQLV
jgi:uncharacterized protein (DUF1800 family)